MPNNPLISIVVPFYNSEQWLDDCIRSIVGQTYPHLEILLVCDGSTDRSLSIAEQWATVDHRIIIINKENGGVSSAKNVGVDACTGEYVAFVDSDDWIEPTMYEELIKFDGQADIIICGINRYTNEGKKFEVKKGKPAKKYLVEEAISAFLQGKEMTCSVYDKLFKRTLFDGIRFPEGRLMEEAFVLPKLFQKAQGIVHTGKALYNYVIRPNSYTTKLLSKECYFIYQTIEEYQKEIVPVYPSVKKVLNTYRYRQCFTLYRRAIRQRGQIEQEVYEYVKKEFNKIWIKALFCMDLTMKERLQVIQTKFHLFM